MEKFKCPICSCERFQQIGDIQAGNLPENKIQGYVTYQDPILVNQYVCMQCGYVYHIVSNESLQKIKNFYDKNDFSNAPHCVTPVKF
jgi:transposase-like protein